MSVLWLLGGIALMAAITVKWPEAPKYVNELISDTYQTIRNKLK